MKSWPIGWFVGFMLGFAITNIYWLNKDHNVELKLIKQAIECLEKRKSLQKMVIYYQDQIFRIFDERKKLKRIPCDQRI